MAVCLICSNVLLADALVAIDSCRTSLNNGTVSEADTNKSDSSKLSVRGDSKAAKSWIKFDVSSIEDKAGLASCRLRITLNASKSSSCLLSAVNDDYTAGMDWTNADLTWNLGPGNITSADGINPDDGSFSVSDLQDNLDLSKTTLVGTVEYSGVKGDQFYVDVLPIIQADTDGIVQFVLHGSGGSTDFATHTHPDGAEYYPTLEYSGVPTGACEGIGTLYTEYADESCRTELFDGTNDRTDDNRTDGTKLSVRSDAKAMKSWIKFDLNDLNYDPNNLVSATLRITLAASKSSTCQLSVVNDNYLTGIDWTESTLTWDNAPGNIPSDDGVNPVDTVNFTVDDLQDNLDTSKTSSVGTVDYTGGLAGDHFFIDVTDAMLNDTDGIIQFVLHGAGGSTNFAVHDYSGGEEYWPQLTFLVGPSGADNPYPCPDTDVTSDIIGLSWTNPDPNDGSSLITPTVYLGTDPNRLDISKMDSIVLPAGTQSVVISEDNFPISYDQVNGGLYNKTQYYWYVDCYDPSAGTIEGLQWSFYVNNNDAPVVDAGSVQVAWLGMSGIPGQEVIDLDGTTSDDGRPVPPAAYTRLWTQVENGAPAVTVPSDDSDDISVTVTAGGDYEFELTANDGEAETKDTVRIVVGETPCDASHIYTGEAYDAGDVNFDCMVNLEDFASIIAANWLDCTDTITDCPTN